MKYHLKIFSILFPLILFICGCSNSMTKNVELVQISCNLNEDEINFINVISQYELDFYKSVFEVKIPQIKIKIFGDSIQYRSFQKKISTSRAKNGFYSKSENVILINKNARYLKTISHEINHFILRNVIPKVPKWINEGLSEYFEFAQLESNKIIIAPQNKKASRLKRWIKESGKIELLDFLDWSNAKWREYSKSPDYYSSTLSWGMVYFLMLQNHQNNYVRSILQQLKSGINSQKIITDIYPGGISGFESDFIRFIETEF